MSVPSNEELSRDLQSLRIQREPVPHASNAPGAGSLGSKLGWLVGALLVAGVGILVWRIAIPRAESSLFKAEVSFTEVSSVSPVQASVEVTSTGYVVPQVVAKVGSKLVERLAKVHVREGAEVKLGSVLFELDPTDRRSAIAAASARVASANARVQAARANLAEIELQWSRQKSLVASGAAAKATAEDLGARVAALREQVNAQQAEVAAASADVATLSVGLRQVTILAPINGTAVTKPAEVGDVVSPGQVLVELVDFSTLLVETDVPEGRMGKIKVGRPTEIVLDAMDDARFRGVVAEVGPRINRSKATVMVKVRFREPPKELRPEMSARVSFLSRELGEAELKQGEKVIVSGNAIASLGGQKVVWVVENDKVRRTPIKLGEAFGTGFVVLEGPRPGAKLVRDPAPTLQDGQGVKEKGK